MNTTDRIWRLLVARGEPNVDGLSGALHGTHPAVVPGAAVGATAFAVNRALHRHHFCLTRQELFLGAARPARLQPVRIDVAAIWVLGHGHDVVVLDVNALDDSDFGYMRLVIAQGPRGSMSARSSLLEFSWGGRKVYNTGQIPQRRSEPCSQCAPPDIRRVS